VIRWQKIRAVALFEFLAIVRSKGYLIATFGMPVFVLAYVGFISMIGYFENKRERTEVATYGVLDEAGILGLMGDVAAAAIPIPQEVRAALEKAGQSAVLSGPLALFQNTVYRPFASEAEAKQDLLAKKLKGYIRVPTNYVSEGILEAYTLDEPSFGGKSATSGLGNLLRDRMLRDKVPAEIAERVRKPVADVKDWTVLASGEIREGGLFRKIAAVVMPFVFSVFLLISLMVSAGGLIQAMAVEKENKVVEVLLASANPDEILMGKLLGVGATGILQVMVWFGMIIVSGLAFAATLSRFGLDVPWAAMLVAVLFFAVAYLFFGSLMLGTGSIGSNQREVQQWAMMWSFLAASPMVFLQFLIHEPNSTLARVLTWVPFSAPVVTVFRMTISPDGIAWWEIAGPLVVLVGATWFAIRMSARLFRVGLLLSGARPKFREIIRQARLN